MNAQLEHLLKLINGEADHSDSAADDPVALAPSP